MCWNDESMSFGIDEKWKKVNIKRENYEHNKLIEEHNELNEEMQQLGKNYNVLLVKHRKFINAHNEVINEMTNDWKQKVEKIPKNETRQHFEMQ